MSKQPLLEHANRQWTDSRRHFAQRFESIAKQWNITTDGMLFVDDAPSLVPPDSAGKMTSRIAGGSDTHRTRSTATSVRSVSHSPNLIVPGLLGSSLRNLVAPLMCARTQLNCLGYDIEIAWVNGRSGCSRNAQSLREQVLRAADRHGAAVNVIGYSKGCADCLHMLGEYTDTQPAVRALVSLAGVVYGTPLAKDPSWALRKLLQYAPLPGTPFGDGQAIVDLSYTVRRQWLEDHPLPPTLYRATIAAAPSPARVSRVLKRSYRTLATLNPANDSQVIDVDTILPDGDLLAIVNADHWAVALPVKERLPLIARLLVNQNSFPRNVLLHALIDHLCEVVQHPDTASGHT